MLLKRWSDRRVACDKSFSFDESFFDVVIVIDIVVDVKCEIMLSYHNKSQQTIEKVMLIDIPDPQTIAGVLIAFVVGIFGVLIYNKIKLFAGQKADPSYMSRLEYYERQLIDMKIRLDALDLEEKLPPNIELSEVEHVLEKKEPQAKKEEREHKIEPEKPIQKPRMPNMDFNGAAEHVLGLITTNEMTSRDIQVTIGRSREHTSRLMKRLYEEGLVERNIKKKPFTYKITDKGKAKVSSLEKSIIA